MRFGRVELLPIYGLYHPKACAVPVYRAPAKGKQFAYTNAADTNQPHHCTVRFGEFVKQTVQLLASLGSNGSDLTGSGGNSTDRAGFDLRFPYFTTAAKMALAAVLYIPYGIPSHASRFTIVEGLNSLRGHLDELDGSRSERTCCRKTTSYPRPVVDFSGCLLLHGKDFFRQVRAFGSQKRLRSGRIKSRCPS